jgi:hypothetical protein
MFRKFLHIGSLFEEKGFYNTKEDPKINSPLV